MNGQTSTAKTYSMLEVGQFLALLCGLMVVVGSIVQGRSLGWVILAIGVLSVFMGLSKRQFWAPSAFYMLLVPFYYLTGPWPGNPKTQILLGIYVAMNLLGLIAAIRQWKHSRV